MNRKQRRTAAKVAKKQPASGAPRAAADNVVQKAIAAAQAGALAEAEAALDKVLEQFPDHVEALHQKGMLLARTHRAEAGIPLLQRITAQKPGEALYWNNLAAACLTCHRPADARAAARKAVDLDAKYAMAWRNLAMAATDLGQHREAAEAYETVTRLTPKDADAWNGLGLAQLELGDAARAETAFAKAVALDPKSAECLSNLGGLLVKRGRGAEALPHLEKAVAIDPDRFASALHYGVALALAGNASQGLRWLRRATSIKPRSDTAWGALADAAALAGEQAEAIDAARRAVEFAPSDATHRTRLQRLQQGAAPRSTLIELDLGTPAQSDQDKADESNLSTSLDQIFIR
jgi:tetratricopeptide (TPR) repeat protein